MEAVAKKTERSWDRAPASPLDTHDFCVVTESAPIPEGNMCADVTPETSVQQKPVEQLHTCYLKQEVTDLQEDVNVKQNDTELQQDVQQDVKKEAGWEETSKLGGVGVSQHLEFANDVPSAVQYENGPGEAGGSGMAGPRGSQTPDQCASVSVDTCEKENAQEAELEQELVVLRKDRARSVKQAREHAASTGANSYDCLMCTRTFKCLTTYKQHMTTMHTGEKPFACEWCNWRFDELNDFKRHLRTHKGEKRLKWKAFYRKLAQHKRNI